MRDWSAIRTTGRPNFRGEMKAAAKRGTTASPRKSAAGDDNPRAEWYPPDWAEISQKIRKRDGYRCSAPGCSSRANLQEHHLRYRSQQGGNEAANLVLLCAFHHLQGEHGGLARCRGLAPLDIVWRLGLDEFAAWFWNERRIAPQLA